MSNHVHVILRSDPGASWQWTDREVAERWLSIFPGSISHRDDPNCVARATLALLGNAERLDVIRQRLGSISWFMRALNEPIARWANREDGCSGRFWEGRYKCQALLDQQAVLSCMAYVDLNPVRAGMCETLHASEHTSVRYRLESAQSAIAKALGKGKQEEALKPVAGLDVDTLSDLTESSYIELVRWTGLQAHPNKRGKLSATEEMPPESLWNVAKHPGEWMRRVQGTENNYYRAIGSAPSVRIVVVSSKIVSKRGRTGADSEVFRRTQKISAGQIVPTT
ncbi:transposase [Wenzhouxiangella sp. AB-CW3]|uniref:transposase n=1 Tax=Wenzhouxiangella sp. AB-CW3 TaxID=2771012 RepID=UPI00168A9D84|nr:transposase [Wenzhouxiangella sp. AB-CW3]QOC21812.1 transposase [Wenzhouxiangella sp. AB-CW3]